MHFINNESRENISELNYIITTIALLVLPRLIVEVLYRTSKVRRTSGIDRIVVYYYLIELRDILWRCYSYYDYSLLSFERSSSAQLVAAC
jgi:hypothetical protein